MYCIDGHNLLGAMGRDGSNQNIDFLIGYLQRYQQKKRQPLVVVFDNTKNHNPLDAYERRGNLEIYFSDPSIDRNADDRIVRLLSKKSSKGITVVTADRDLRDRLLMAGINDFLTPEQFISIVEKPAHSSAESEEMSKDEELAASGIDREALNDELLEIFNRRGKD